MEGESTVTTKHKRLFLSAELFGRFLLPPIRPFHFAAVIETLTRWKCAALPPT